jgi:hypothetical protein
MWEQLPDGRYAWLPRVGAEARSRSVVVAAAHRLSAIAAGRGDRGLAVEALRTGLRAVPTAEQLWHDLLRLEHDRGGPAAAAGIADELYLALSAYGVPGGALAETDALVEALVPGYRRRSA